MWVRRVSLENPPKDGGLGTLGPRALASKPKMGCPWKPSPQIELSPVKALHTLRLQGQYCRTRQALDAGVHAPNALLSEHSLRLVTRQLFSSYGFAMTCSLSCRKP